MLRKASLHTRLCNWSRSELAGAPAAPNFGVVNFRSGPTKSAAGVWSVVLPPMLFPERGEPRSVHLPMAHEPGSGAVREGCALAAGPGDLREVWAQARCLLRRAGQVHARLLLHRHRSAG